MCPYARAFGEHRDAERFAREYIPTLAVLERADLRQRPLRRARAARSARASSTSSSAATSAWSRRAPPATAWTTSTSTSCARRSEPAMSDAGAGLRGPEAAALRPPDVVMRLARMGAAHQTRLSFLRAMLRRAARDELAVHAPALRHRRARCRRRRLSRGDRERGPTASSPSATTCRRSSAPTASSPRPGTRPSRSTTACPTMPRSSACAGTCRSRRPAAICRAI